MKKMINALQASVESESFAIDHNECKTEIIWGVHEGPDEIHIIPCYKNLDFMLPHITHRNCSCHPEISSEGDEYKTVVEHNMIH